MAECCGCGARYRMSSCKIDVDCVGLCRYCREALGVGRAVLGSTETHAEAAERICRESLESEQ